MHIITGLAIAAIATKWKSDTALAGLPRFATGPVRVAHALPGRIRFSVPCLRGTNPKDIVWLKEFKALEGVKTAEVRTISGSMIITYDVDTVDPPLLFGALTKFLGVEEKVAQGTTPLLIQELQRLGSSANFSVYNATRGIADLRSLLIFALLVVGARKTLESGWAALPTGATLLWWALTCVSGGRMNGS